MPTSPLKRPSGRLGRLLASLRPPVQTGFPTSLADLVVKNHGRLRNPKRRRVRPSAAPPAAADPPPPPMPPERCEVVVTVQKNATVAAVVRPNPTTKGAAFTVRPEVLAVGGAVALALLVIWSRWLVAAATAASVALVWVESVSVRSSSAARRTEGPVASCGLVSPIREAEAGTPRSSCADSGSEVSFSLWAPDTAADQLRGDDYSIAAPQTSKEEEKRRPSSLRKLIARKLRTGGKRKSVNNNSTAPVPVANKTEPSSSPAPPAVVVDTQTPPVPEEDVVETRVKAGGAASPSAAALVLVPTILVGLVAGKLPAVALTVLCAVFFFSGSAQAQPSSSAESAGRLGASSAS